MDNHRISRALSITHRLDSNPSKISDLFQSSIRPLAILSVLFGFITLLGYLNAFEFLYRPIPDGPATNPTTVLCIIFIGLGLLLNNKQKKFVLIFQRLFLVSAIVITLIRITDALFNLDNTTSIIPFHDYVQHEMALGKTNVFGVNSAIMLFCIASSILLNSFQKYRLSQLIASIAVAIPLVSFVAYVYGLNQVYGQMSLLTATIGVILALSSLALTADHWLMKAVFSAHICGQVARYQLLLVYLIPVLFGYLIIKITIITESEPLSLFVVAMHWFIMMMVGFSALAIEKVDRQRRNHEADLAYSATHDKLTGLENRAALEERLKHAMISARRHKSYLAIILIDLDNFKDINDTLGHDVGDALLIEVSRRLKRSMREMDIVVRLGGDEFVVIFTDLDDKWVSQPMATYLTHILSQPFQILNHSVSTSPSMGISFFPDNGNTNRSLMKHADMAMYRAKELGRHNFQYFDEKLNQELAERITLEFELKKAIQEKQFTLYYQPKVEANNTQLKGFEVLIRWQHPEKGLIFPDKFIPYCESSKLIVPIGDWVLNEACQQLSKWQESDLSKVSLAINLSLQQIQKDDFVEKIQSVIQKYFINPELLELEITESIAMQDPDMIIDKLTQLKQLGVKLSIDDFGTGYSSLMYLKQLPVDTLKIDRNFVMNLETDENDVQIVSATISLAHNLGILVVAEGVEKQYHVDFLRQHECDYLQGYHFSKPMPLQDIKEYIKNSGGEHATLV